MESCYFCDSEDNIEQHHIVPQRLGGTDAKHNLVEVCHDCHWKLERLYNKDFYEALGIEDPRATEGTHVTCEYHDCVNPAVGRFEINPSGIRVGNNTRAISSYRCDEHRPMTPDEDRTERKSLKSADNVTLSEIVSPIELFLEVYDAVEESSKGDFEKLTNITGVEDYEIILTIKLRS